MCAVHNSLLLRERVVSAMEGSIVPLDFLIFLLTFVSVIKLEPFRPFWKAITKRIFLLRPMSNRESSCFMSLLKGHNSRHKLSIVLMDFQKFIDFRTLYDSTERASPTGTWGGTSAANFSVTFASASRSACDATPKPVPDAAGSEGHGLSTLCTNSYLEYEDILCSASTLLSATLLSSGVVALRWSVSYIVWGCHTVDVLAAGKYSTLNSWNYGDSLITDEAASARLLNGSTGTKSDYGSQVESLLHFPFFVLYLFSLIILVILTATNVTYASSRIRQFATFSSIILPLSVVSGMTLVFFDVSDEGSIGGGKIVDTNMRHGLVLMSERLSSSLAALGYDDCFLVPHIGAAVQTVICVIAIWFALSSCVGIEQEASTSHLYKHRKRFIADPLVGMVEAAARSSAEQWSCSALPFFASLTWLPCISGLLCTRFVFWVSS
eukprot:GHVQ01014029.1.p1 GENE.GHVQ01014029.1~~GHVQ01014029.1.p1  ORF type:complete len:437 (+),score=12.22 GHVQ01014029.1:88-1398(+)